MSEEIVARKDDSLIEYVAQKSLPAKLKESITSALATITEGRVLNFDMYLLLPRTEMFCRCPLQLSILMPLPRENPLRQSVACCMSLSPALKNQLRSVVMASRQSFYHKGTCGLCVKG